MCQLQHQLAFWLTRSIAQEGSAVLIFVSGIADIEALMEQFEQIPRYVFFKMLPALYIHAGD